MGERRTRPVSAFAVAVFALSAALSLPVLDSYALDLAGLAFTIPRLAVLLAIEAAALGLALWRLGWRPAWTEQIRLVGGAVAFLALFAPTLFLIWPTFLPVTYAVDAVHHYLLVDYIYQHQRLVHDPSVGNVLVEMVGYPFAACLLAALAAHLLGQPPLYLMTAMCAVFLGYTALFAYAIVTELVPGRRARLLALLVPLLLLWPVPYTLGQFTRDFYLTQMLGVGCVIGLGYWLAYYLRHEDRAALLPMVGLGATLIFSYPTLMPPFALAFVLAPFLAARHRSFRRLIADSALVGLPLAAVAALYLHDRVGLGMGILRNDGSTVAPSLGSLPLGFLLLAALGLGLATWYPTLRSFALLAWGTLLQTALIYGAVAYLHQLSPYAGKKMFFLIAPELAVLGGLAVAIALSRIALPRGGALAAGGAALGLTLAVGYGASRMWLGSFYAYDPHQTFRLVLTPDQLAVANWAKLNLSGQQLTYAADNPLTAYWVDVGLLKHPRYPQPKFTVVSATQPKEDPRCAAGSGGYRFVVQDFDAWSGGGVETVFRRGDAGIVRSWSDARVTLLDNALLLTTGGKESNLTATCAVAGAATAAPGSTVPIAVLLKASPPVTRHYLLEARLRDRNGEVVSHADVPILPFDKPAEVSPGQVLGIRSDLAIPPSLPPGAYNLELVFFDDRWGALRIARPGSYLQTALDLGGLTVASARELPDPDTRPATVVGDHLGDVLDLVGFDRPVVGDGALSLDLYWRATRPIPRDYTFFVQVLNDQGKVVAQRDSYPWDGRYPTSAWQPGRLVRDHDRLALPPGLPAGTYRLIVGAYQLDGLRRLPVLGPDGQRKGDEVSLMLITT